MKIGAERNKLILLAVLSVVAAATVYEQFLASDAVPAPPPRPAVTAAGQGNGQVARRPAASQRPAPRRGDRFRPSFGSGSDAPLDPLEVDPTLRTDLLAKVESVEFQGVERNVFEFTARKAKVKPPSPEDVALAQKRLEEAKAQPPPAAAESSKPRAPRITWRYCGFANRADDSRKRAFLLDGEEVFVATEGDVFKQRYKIIRIGVNSIVIEDMQFSDQQTLPLEAG